MAGRCPACAAGHLARDAARRRRKPQRRVWDSARWRRVRELVYARDGYRCVDCGRHRDELAPNEVLVADHVDGVLDVADPYDLAGCVTLCSTCSGRRDGSRAHER